MRLTFFTFKTLITLTGVRQNHYHEEHSALFQTILSLVYQV